MDSVRIYIAIYFSLFMFHCFIIQTERDRDSMFVNCTIKMSGL